MDKEKVVEFLKKELEEQRKMLKEYYELGDTNMSIEFENNIYILKNTIRILNSISLK